MIWKSFEPNNWLYNQKIYGFCTQQNYKLADGVDNHINFFYRDDMTMKVAILYIACITLLSAIASSPMFYMDLITKNVEFPKTISRDNLSTCTSTWSQNAGMAYKTFSCVFQFIIPLCAIVSKYDKIRKFMIATSIWDLAS